MNWNRSGDKQPSRNICGGDFHQKMLIPGTFVFNLSGIEEELGKNDGNFDLVKLAVEGERFKRPEVHDLGSPGLKLEALQAGPSKEILTASLKKKGNCQMESTSSILEGASELWKRDEEGRDG